MAASSGRRSRARPRHLHRRKPRASKRAKIPLMRHRNYGSKLGRQPAHRRATLRNLVTNVIERERITTTLTRARAAKPLVEQMITLGKRDTPHSRRQAECNHLFDERFRSPGARERGGNPLALDDVG